MWSTTGSSRDHFRIPTSHWPARSTQARFSGTILLILPKSSSMSAKALRLFATVENQLLPWQPSNSALSGSDRHDFAVSQGLEYRELGGWPKNRRYSRLNWLGRS